MPEVIRGPLRMTCTGIDLVHPIDRMPEGAFAYLFNTRVLEEGRFDGRPGYTQLLTLADIPNSIRRLNDPDKSTSAAGYIYVGGGGTNLYAGNEFTSYSTIDTGYSGNPLSLIPFRPDQSPESWMYVYDANKQVKVNAGLTIREIGVTPPNRAPVIEYGIPATVDIDTGQGPAGQWTPSGAATAVFSSDRTNGSAPNAVFILYDSGNTGWCCIYPNITNPFWAGERMKIILNSGGANQEEVVVRNILNPITPTSVSAIHYDIGVNGLCSIVLTGNPAGLSRNSIIEIAGEPIRVLEVILSPDGTTYSLRCSTAATHISGDPVIGFTSWYVYTVQTHLGGESITSNFIRVSQGAAGTGLIIKSAAINGSSANNRPIDPANDYLHISVYLLDPPVVTSLMLMITLDITPNFSFTNPGNAYVFTITPDQLGSQGASSNSWVDLVIPISSGVRSGIDLSLTLANISGIALQLITTANCDWGFDWWYLFGTYGPLIQTNSPTGYVYQSRFRDSSTGAHSVPGPQDRYQIFPLRESVIITPATSTQAGVDSIDIYRFGGTIGTTTTSTTSLYVGTVPNDPAVPKSYTDALPDLSVLETNQPPDLTAIQPWPVLGLPISGTVIVDGTTVLWVNGGQWNVNMLSDTVIIINGTAFLTYGQPRSSTVIELTQDAGNLLSATFQIASPTLAAQPLPFAFGPLEGPFAPIIFALGDPINGGFLYFSNASDADSASDANTLEVSTPSSELVSGAVWNGLVFVGNKDDVFCVRYSYLTTIGASNNTSFQWARIPVPSGMWSRWSSCACPIGVAYLGRDGLYIVTESGGVNITDERLYPLFPHDGQPAQQINFGTDIILPVDMTRLNLLRLTYTDEALEFCYVDTGNNFNTLRYEIYRKRWFLNNYADDINLHYLIEGDVASPTTPQILQMDLTNHGGAYFITLAGGDTDNGDDINTIVLTPSFDSGDQRSQKLYVDQMCDSDCALTPGSIDMLASFNDGQQQSPLLSVACTTLRTQTLQPLSAISDLALYRNIAGRFAWTGGPNGPRLYAWEYSGYTQPYLSNFMVTQQLNLSFPGWKHMRRAYPALISNSPVLFTILTQDGRVFGPYTIPSTGGLYRQLPFMLDQTLKDLAFAFQLDGQGKNFAPFLNDFVIEVKQWNEASYIQLAIFKS